MKRSRAAGGPAWDDRSSPTDDGPIREVGPDDVWVDPADQPRRRRRSSRDDSPRARIRATMARWRAAERERKRRRRHKHKPKRGSKAIIRALLPAPSDEATPCPTKERDTSDANVTRSRPATRSGPALNVPLGSVAASDQTIVVEMEFTPGVIAVLRRRGFLTGETPDDIAAAVFGMLVEAVEAGIRARPAPTPSPPAPQAPPPVAATTSRRPAKAQPAAKAPSPPASPRQGTAGDPFLNGPHAGVEEQAGPHPEVGELADESDAPAAPPARRTNGEEFDTEGSAARGLFQTTSRGSVLSRDAVHRTGPR
jgi:hypothetical protein